MSLRSNITRSVIQGAYIPKSFRNEAGYQQDLLNVRALSQRAPGQPLPQEPLKLGLAALLTAKGF